MPQASVADTVTEGSLDVHLESVARAHPAIERTGRNPFRFGQSSQGGPTVPDFTTDGVPERPVLVVRDRPGASVNTLSGRLRFIGLVEAPHSAGQIVVLSDGDTVFHGREGETVDGQYRIMRNRDRFGRGGVSGRWRPPGPPFGESLAACVQKPDVESPGGISPPGAHGTGHERLRSSGSYRPAAARCNKRQWAKSPGSQAAMARIRCSERRRCRRKRLYFPSAQRANRRSRY